MDLAQLHFGRDDVESDIAECGRLRAGYLHTTAYSASLSGRKRLISRCERALTVLRSPRPL